MIPEMQTAPPSRRWLCPAWGRERHSGPQRGAGSCRPGPPRDDILGTAPHRGLARWVLPLGDILGTVPKRGPAGRGWPCPACPRLRLPPCARQVKRRGITAFEGSPAAKPSRKRHCAAQFSRAVTLPVRVPRVCFKLIASLLDTHEKNKNKPKNLIQCEITVIDSQNKLLLNWLGKPLIRKPGRYADFQPSHPPPQLPSINISF